jgi:hypothetical protein
LASYCASAGGEVTVNVDFKNVTGTQQMAFGTNELTSHVAESTVASEYLNEINTQYCRVWFGGGNHPGPQAWDWSGLDRDLEVVCEAGAKPMVCFAGLPDWMNDDENYPHGDGHRSTWNHPRDHEEWGQYCVSIVQHCEQLATARGWPGVEQWLWEVWNEPDNYYVSGGWSEQEFSALYAAAATALRNAYPDIRVGGPATDHGSRKFILPLLDHGHDIQFISWHKYGALDYPDDDGVFHKPSWEYLHETRLFGAAEDDGDVFVKQWIENRRPGEGILSVCGEVNLNAYCCGTDKRIWGEVWEGACDGGSRAGEPCSIDADCPGGDCPVERDEMIIAWYASMLRHMIRNGTDIEMFYVGTDKHWPNFGLFFGIGPAEGLRSPAFFSKRLFSTAAPQGSLIVASDISGSDDVEVFATRIGLLYKHVILINKTPVDTPVTLDVAGTTVTGGTWYTCDSATYAQYLEHVADLGPTAPLNRTTGIRGDPAPAGNRQSITLRGYTVRVLEIDEGDDPDSDADDVLNLFDNCRHTANPQQADADRDGVGDACDQCPDTLPDRLMSTTGCATTTVDFDRDGDVDMNDFAHFQACMTGGGHIQDDIDCADARIDDDNDVDAEDMAAFQQCLSGDGIRAAPDCLDPPTIALSPGALTQQVRRGEIPLNSTFVIANGANGILSYEISDDADWIRTVPDHGHVIDASAEITVIYSTLALDVGSYSATINVDAFGATNTPQPVTVELIVQPPLFARADFDRDGDVDMEDFGRFQACYSGAGVPQQDPDCQPARLDEDDDVDADDWTRFMQCLQGAGVIVDTLCDGYRVFNSSIAAY